MSRLSLAVALGVGVGGALVDVSSYARLTDGLSRRWGRDDAFYGVEPGTFSFTLDNSDGRFTPENPGSPLATTLTEGMLACVQVGSRLTGGTVRRIEPAFPGGDAAWASVRVTCEDAFGDLARAGIGSPTETAAFVQGAQAFWPMSDPSGSRVAESLVPDALDIMWLGATSVQFEVAGTAPGARDQATVSVATGRSTLAPALVAGVFDPSQFTPGLAFGVWVTPRNGTSKVSFDVFLSDGNPLVLFASIGIDNDRFTADGLFSAPFETGRAYHLACERVGNTVTTYIDGVAFSSYTGVPSSGNSGLSISVGAVGYGPNEFSLADVTVTAGRIFAEGLIASNAEDRLTAISQMSRTSWATIPAALSPAQLTVADIAGGSVLDTLNDVMITEQGDVYTTTTGTLTNPATQIVVRERARPETVSYTFNVEEELSGAPGFIRDLTNLVSRVTVSSATGDTVVIDDDLTARAGQSSRNETVLLAKDVDRRAWGQDRLIRGANTKLRIASVVVDAMTTPTDRSADLLALTPGDRVQFTGLPETVLGFDTWDGWFLGARETHTISEHAFELHFAPVLPDTAIYDTDRYMASGELTLNGAINSSVTSISVESTGALLSTTETPYTIQFDDEQMTVTAVSGTSSPQTVTVTRGVNGTTAASHADNAVLVSVPDSLYAF